MKEIEIKEDIVIDLNNINDYILRLNNINKIIDNYQNINDYENINIKELINLKNEGTIIFEKINFFLKTLINEE